MTEHPTGVRFLGPCDRGGHPDAEWIGTRLTGNGVDTTVYEVVACGVCGDEPPTEPVSASVLGEDPTETALAEILPEPFRGFLHPLWRALRRPA